MLLFDLLHNFNTVREYCVQTGIVLTRMRQMSMTICIEINETFSHFEFLQEMHAQNALPMLPSISKNLMQNKESMQTSVDFLCLFSIRFNISGENAVIYFDFDWM